MINPIRTEGVSRKHTSYIIDSHVKMSEVNGFFFLDFANWAFPNTSKKSLLKNLSKIFEKIRSEALNFEAIVKYAVVAFSSWSLQLQSHVFDCRCQQISDLQMLFIHVQTCPDMSKHVQTCPEMSRYVQIWPNMSWNICTCNYAPPGVQFFQKLPVKVKRKVFYDPSFYLRHYLFS